MNTITCPNCGAEIYMTPVLVKDSRSKAVVNDNKHGAPLRDSKGRFVGVDLAKDGGVKCMMHGVSLAGEECDVEHNDDEPLSERVRKQGHVKNHRLFRRWIMSQMFHTLLTMKNWNEGFAKLVRNRGLRYMWKVLRQEMHDMRAIQRHGDTEEFDRRNRWWSADAVYGIACSFAFDLEKETARLKIRKCKGREYVTIPGFGMVFCDEVNEKIIVPLHDRIEAFHKCNCQKTADALCDFASQFKDSTAWKLGMPTEFIDRFKGAGAYFTLRNMLMFHDCRIPYEAAQKFGKKGYNTDLEVLDLAAEEYKDQGWQLLGLLKDTIKLNGIDVEEKIRSWRKD